eukprot:UN26787
MVSMSFIDCMILGSLISAVDPIATIVVLEKLGVDPTLYILIFGESVLNDAAAIVINRTFVELRKTGGGTDVIIPAGATLLLNAVVSIAIGIIFGLMSNAVHQYSSLHKHNHLEVGAFFLFSYAPYVCAEMFGFSGVMAILFTGIVQDYWTSGFLSPVACESVHTVTKGVASLLESFIFVYLGMALFLTNRQHYN